MENNRSILLLSGLPGVGKSELAKELAKQCDVVSISTDSIRQEIFGEPKLTIEETILVYGECVKRIEKYSESNYQTVIVDTTCLPKNERRDGRLLVASEVAARKTGRFLLKLALIASPETIIERNYIRATSDVNKKIDDAYPSKVLDLERLFSWSLPMGESWNYIDTDNITKLELARLAISMLLNGEPEEPKINNQINAIMAQFYSDTFHNELLDCWYEVEKGGYEIPSVDERFSKYSRNRGVLNTYGASMKLLKSDDLQDNLSELFKTINKDVKDDCFFTPENGTLLRNVTAFCLSITGNKDKSCKMAPWVDDSYVRERSMITKSIKIPEADYEYPSKLYNFEVVNNDDSVMKYTLSTIIDNDEEKFLCISSSQ